MSIAWQYLDKRSATICALKDYESMKYILAHAPADISLLQADMVNISPPQLSSMPKAGRNVHAGESRIVKYIDSAELLNERYLRAQEFCSWFQPAWEGLSEAERYVLTCFYTDENAEQNGIDGICDHFHIERTSAYKKKDRALAHLTLLLYGK